MKRITVVLAVAVAATLGFVACGSAPAQPQPDPVSEFIREVRRGTPENAILGIGTSTHANRGLARTTAETRARAEIARQVDVTVRNMIMDYTAGSEAEMQALLQFTESVTQTLTQHAQRGAIIRDENFINGEQITVVMLSEDSLRQGLLNASQSAAALAPHMGNAMWALDRMNEALGVMNAAETANPTLRNFD